MLDSSSGLLGQVPVNDNKPIEARPVEPAITQPQPPDAMVTKPMKQFICLHLDLTGYLKFRKDMTESDAITKVEVRVKLNNIEKDMTFEELRQKLGL